MTKEGVEAFAQALAHALHLQPDDPVRLAAMLLAGCGWLAILIQTELLEVFDEQLDEWRPQPAERRLVLGLWLVELFCVFVFVMPTLLTAVTDFATGSFAAIGPSVPHIGSELLALVILAGPGWLWFQLLKPRDEIHRVRLPQHLSGKRT